MLTISGEFNLANNNKIQLLVTTILMSTAVGGLIAGPLADSWGRKPIAFCGGTLFLCGCTIAAHAPSIDSLLLARLLQGLGLAGTRVAMHAIIRDRFSGDDMAKVLSYSAAVFLLVPLLAPSLGQWVLVQSGTWRTVFYAQAIVAVAALTWLAIRQPETQPAPTAESKQVSLLKTYLAIWNIHSARRYMFASCFALTPLMSFLALAPQLLQSQYQFTNNFPLIFATLSIPVGLFSIANGLWVKRIGALTLLRISLRISAGCSILFLPTVWFFSGHPPSIMMLSYLLVTLASFGLITSNITSLAMEQLGKFAGTGSAMYGALATGGSALLASIVANFYAGSPMPLVACSALSCLVCLKLTKNIHTL